MALKRHLAAPLLATLGLVVLLPVPFCARGFCQTLPSSSSAQTTPSKSSLGIAPPSSPAPASPTETAPSLLSLPAEPAKVSLTSDKLIIEANNSTLAEILYQISQAGGMKIQGLDGGRNADQRVFGTYGPGAPRDVLSELLNGSGYNVLMLGEMPSGVPRKLALSARPAGGIPSQPASANNARENYSENEIQPTSYPDAQEDRPNPPPVPPGMQNGIRTPQQILEELQRMRDQQQQQNQSN